MLLTELELHNVGVYTGRQVVDLRTTPERPVVLIGGLNGCGKTTFLDALQLVLYGNRARLSNRGSQGYEDFLRATISRKVRPEEGASISLTFTIDADGDQREYCVTRSWATAGKRTKETLSVYVDGEWGKAISDGWSDHIEEILPLEVASLFFFDGEKIEALADSERAATVIQSAVHSLLGISTLEQLRNDLLALQRRQVPAESTGALDQKVLDLTEEHKRSQAQLDDTAQRRAKVRQQLAQAEQHLSSSERLFAQNGGGLYERRAALEADRRATSGRLDDCRSDLRSLAEGLMPIALVGHQVQSVITQLELESKASEASVVVDLLELRDEWLLSLVPDEGRERVREGLAGDREGRRRAALTDSYLGLTEAEIRTVRSLSDQLASQRDACVQLLGQVDRLQEELDQIDSQLAGVPDTDSVAKLEFAVREARDVVSGLAGQLAVLDEDLERIRRERMSIEDRLSRAEGARLRELVTQEDAMRVVEHTERVRGTLLNLRESLVLRHLSKIEIATLDSFTRLMRKQGLVADLRIDPSTFEIQLSAASGEVVSAARLSAGERQLLAVALLWGLARVAGNRLPTVIDTPLGRLDSRHREHLVDRYFPEANGQVLLLSTDEEIDEALLARLAPAISHAYVLEHDDNHHTTSIRPGYWWPVEVPRVA